MSMTRYLTERENDENNENKYERTEGSERYVSHEIVKKIFENNKDFYDDVVYKNFDIKLFEQSFKKRKWCPRQVVGFLAFGRVIGYDVGIVIKLLGEYCPNWRPQFWWFVFSQKM